MIRADVVAKIRLSTCGVVRLVKPHQDLFPGAKPGDKLSARPYSEVVASGFLVRPNLVLTNRHVVERVVADHRKQGHHNNWYLEFTYPGKPGSVSLTTQRISNVFAIVDPAGTGKLDVGLLEFNRGEDGDLHACQPVVFGELAQIQVGADIGVCGFPHGNVLLRDSPGINRWGPVIHQGLISGVSPYESANPRDLTAFLTDIYSAPGMSGSPVFVLPDGQVVGLHYGGLEGTVGAAIPLDAARVEGWISLYQETIASGGQHLPLILNGGGDIPPSS